MPAPVKSIRVGGVQASIWENPLKDGSGVIRSVTFDKSYKVGDEWKKTQSFKIGDIAQLQLALQKVLEFHYLKSEEEF